MQLNARRTLLTATLAGSLTLAGLLGGCGPTPPADQQTPAQEAAESVFRETFAENHRALKGQDPETRLGTYRAELSKVEAFDWPISSGTVSLAAFAATQIARIEIEFGRNTDALATIDSARDRWPNCDPSVWANFTFLEARAIQRLGALDQAGVRFGEAKRMIDVEAAAAPGSVSIGTYFNIQLGLIEFIVQDGRPREALRMLDLFEPTIDWDWIAERETSSKGELNQERVRRNRYNLQLLRAACLAAIDTPESRERARGTLLDFLSTELAPVDLLISANMALIGLWERDHPGTEPLELLANLERAFEEQGGARNELQALTRAAARYRGSTSEGQRGAALGELFLAIENFMDYRNENSLPGGSAASMYDQWRAACEIHLEALPPEDLLPFLISIQRSGRIWDHLGKPNPSSTAVVGSLCAPDSGVLIYQRGDRNDYWVAVGLDEVPILFRVPLADDSRELRAEFQMNLARSPESMSPIFLRGRPDLLKESGTEIARTLFPAALREHLSGWSKVFIVGRDELDGLALEALPLDGDIPFGCSHAIVGLPSLAVAEALATRASAAKGRSLVRVVADPIVPDDIQEKYGVRGDLELTKDSLHEDLGLGPAAKYELGEQARGAAIAAGQTDAILHLIVHGVPDRFSEMPIHLALTPESTEDTGLLSVQGVREQSCAPLVLLSVCSGANSAPRSGDAGANNLGGAFVEAGAHSVVLSSGDVQLSATLVFYREFYRALASGVDSAEAARLARVALMQNARYLDPFHWGQVRVFGVGR